MTRILRLSLFWAVAVAFPLPLVVLYDDRCTLTFTIRQHGNYTRRLGGVEEGTRVRLEGRACFG